MPNTITEEHQDIESYKPSHPTYFRVLRQGSPGEFSSKLVTERAFLEGSVIADLKGLTAGEKRYSSVQISETEHVELNSDLVFMNHSCDPTAVMDVDRMVVTATRDLAAGDEITFFYPSTEWDMAQPFSCWCGSSKCIQTVKGAHHLSTETLKQFHLSKHINQLINKRDIEA
ncbi:hypothetical protein G6F56_010513 [Rhizopus delemar]|nr:hypothetical protein G6F56_010513 [Rhizopus delemar]